MQQSLERITIQQQMIASQLLDATVTYEEMTKQQALLQEELSAFERQKENVTTQGETLKKEEMILESTLTHLEKEQQTLQQTVTQLVVGALQSVENFQLLVLLVPPDGPFRLKFPLVFVLFVVFL